MFVDGSFGCLSTSQLLLDYVPGTYPLRARVCVCVGYPSVDVSPLTSCIELYLHPPCSRYVLLLHIQVPNTTPV